MNHSEVDATLIYDEVLLAVKQWRGVANRLGISRGEQLVKQTAFNV